MMSNQLNSRNNDDDIRNAFRVFDKDGSGFINFKELKEAMANIDGSLTDEDIDEMIREADLNRDGQISFEGIFSK